MIIIMLVYLLLFAFCLTILHISTRYSEYGRLIDKIPGPPTLPIIGNLLLAFNISLEEAWSKVRNLYGEYYPVFRIWKVTNAIVFTCNADDIKIALSCKKNINKSDTSYSYIRSTINDGILVSGGSLWHDRRRILNQAFTPDFLKHYFKIVTKQTEIFVIGLRCQDKIMVQNISPIFLKFSLRAALEATMGFDLNKINPKEEEEYTEAFSEFSEIVMYRVCRPYLQDWMIKFLSVGRQLKTIMAIIDNLATKVLESRRVYHEHLDHSSNFKKCTQKVETVKFVEDVQEQNQCLLITDVLLLAEKKGLIDNRGMMNEVSAILLAGFETTGTAICYLLVLLAENKHAQDLVRAEILEILGNNNNKIIMKDIEKMKYLDCCVKESLRLFPPVPHIGRTITGDLELRKYKVPSGTELHMSIYDLHRDPKLWPEPDRFNPERFLLENIKERHPFAYAPFSGGLRNCIGQKLALVQMKILAAYMIHNFNLEPVDLTKNFKFELKITMRLDNIRLKSIRIDRQ